MKIRCGRWSILLPTFRNQAPWQAEKRQSRRAAAAKQGSQVAVMQRGSGKVG